MASLTGTKFAQSFLFVTLSVTLWLLVSTCLTACSPKGNVPVSSEKLFFQADVQ